MRSRRQSKPKALPRKGIFSSRGFMSNRTASVTSRCPVGTLNLDGSGNITTIGSYTRTASASTDFLLKPVNFGWVADLASHFAYWRLRGLRFKYRPTISMVTTNSTVVSNGVVMWGVEEDVGRLVPTPTTSILELRSAAEFDLSRPATLQYTPTGPSASWLDASQGSTAITLALSRQSCAGCLAFGQRIASTIVSAAVGDVYLEFDIEFKGSALLSVPTSIESASEEKKESVVQKVPLRATAREFLSDADYELVDLRGQRFDLRAKPTGAGEKR